MFLYTYYHINRDGFDVAVPTIVLYVSEYVVLKPRANGRNVVGLQLPTWLDVTCCVRLHTLLHVVAFCSAKFKTGQTFQPTTPNISFVP